MTHSTFKFGLPVAIALAAASAAAVAQQQEPTSNIKVDGGQVQVTTVGLSEAGIPIERFQLDRTVSYANLDLSTPAGVTELKKRVRETARQACEALGSADLTDLSEMDNGACVRNATENAMAQVNAAIANARPAARG
jgi:UrcA family protein